MAETARFLAAIASPRRREILRLLWGEELSASEVRAAFSDVTFGAVSLQLRALKEAGLVESRAAGRHRLYRVHPEARGAIAQILEPMWRDALWSLKLAAELEESRRGPGANRRREARKKR